MPIYHSTEQLYDCLQTLFTRILSESPDGLDSLSDSKLIFRFECTVPQGEFTINGRVKPVETHFGPTSIKPVLDIVLPADTLHGIMLGELGIMKSLGSGKLKIKGPMLKAKALSDLFSHSQTLYPQILREKGVL
ncbi:MAG: SCP2 sterol-binding domain-containing protein [Anaerolineales bacterium]|nr:SCP2 sterol-binding domain-containing protein [Anaerolineales bacterium]